MIPKLILSDSKGNIYVHPTLKMAAGSAKGFVLPEAGSFLPLPKGSTFLYMPFHAAVGWDEASKTLVRVEEFGTTRAFPVSAFLIPGFTRTYLPAAIKSEKGATLPLWPYAACGYLNGKFYAAAIPIDTMRRQKPHYYANMYLNKMKKNIKSVLKQYPKNRLLKHLSHCSLFYNCRNAQNLFLNRWEAPLPVSPACNARCIGCLSFQDTECAQSSHERIDFVPTAKEVCEVGIYHLKNSRQPQVSFGQGCEGEPLLQFRLLEDSISLMRASTGKGTIHLNTNGSCAEYIEKLARAGLDSVRISLNSLKPALYGAYYRPRGYGLGDVLDSIKTAKKNGLFVSLNFLTFPGFSDSKEEVERLVKFLKKRYVDLLQLRNLSIDPDFLLSRMPVGLGPAMGIVRMIEVIKRECPGLRMGYFNVPRERF